MPAQSRNFKRHYIFLQTFLPFPSVPEWHVPESAVPSDWVLESEDKWSRATTHPHHWVGTWVR